MRLVDGAGARRVLRELRAPARTSKPDLALPVGGFEARERGNERGAFCQARARKTRKSARILRGEGLFVASEDLEVALRRSVVASTYFAVPLSVLDLRYASTHSLWYTELLSS